MTTSLAALLTGIGGLLLQLALVRRYALLMGGTADAAAVVMSWFMLGLGAGGLLALRLAARPERAGRRAAALYAAVGLSAVVAEPVLARLGSVSFGAGAGLAALAPGLPAVAMGAAFPLLFALMRPGTWRAGWLVGVNTAGSVAGAWAGGNLLVPSLGLARTGWLAAACYGGAAVLLVQRRPPSAAPAAPVSVAAAGLAGPGWRGVGAALASGALVLGVEVLLLRRLPFWFEGFQPTLSAVVAVCLLAMALGAFLGAPVLAALCGRRAPAVALAVGAVSAGLGLHEHLGPWLARLPATSTATMHLRAAVGALSGALLPCFCAGAVVPLLVGREVEPARRARRAGRLLFAQGIGALLGALLVGRGLPLLAADRFFAVAPPVLAALALLPLLRRPRRLLLPVAAVVAAAVLGFGAAGKPWAPGAPMAGARHDHPEWYRHLAHRTDAYGTASVVYDRRNHSMLLFTDGFRAAETGPGTDYMKALGHLPFLLRDGLRDVAVIALGTGTTADALTQWPEPAHIDVVEISPAVFSLAGHFGADGPVMAARRQPRFAADPRVVVHIDDGRRYLASRAPRSLDLVTLEPLLPYAPGTTALYSDEFYALATAALRAEGLLVQWVPTHAMPRAAFDTLLATFARSVPHVSVWLVDQSTLLVGSQAPLDVDAEIVGRARLAAASPELVRHLHETGLASVADLRAARVGGSPLPACAAAPTLTDDRPFLERLAHWSGVERLSFFGDNLRRLIEVAGAAPKQVRRLRGRAAAAQIAVELARGDLDGARQAARRAVEELAAARRQWPASVLLHREETAALRAQRELSVQLGRPHDARAQAMAHLRRDPRSATLVACLALPDGFGRSLGPAARALALGAAQALDPMVFDTVPLLADLRPEAAAANPLEDLDRLPPAAALAERVAAPTVDGWVLRAVFPVRAGRALLAVLARRPLTVVERDALLVTLDPLLLAEAAAAIEARGGDRVVEGFPLWRDDLPLPPAWAAAAADPPQRVALAEAIAGHRDPASAAALAALLLDEVLAVRRAAAASLLQTFGDEPAYDPEWDESRRRAAADRLRRLHNPKP